MVSTRRMISGVLFPSSLTYCSRYLLALIKVSPICHPYLQNVNLIPIPPVNLDVGKQKHRRNVHGRLKCHSQFPHVYFSYCPANIFNVFINKLPPITQLVMAVFDLCARACRPAGVRSGELFTKHGFSCVVPKLIAFRLDCSRRVLSVLIQVFLMLSILSFIALRGSSVIETNACLATK